MRRPGLRVVPSLVGAAFAAALAARAQSPSWRVEWVAPQGCPDAAQVDQKVVRLLGASQAREPVSARIVVTREPSGYRALMDTTEGTSPGQRTFEGATCEDVADASALFFALLVDPNAVARSSATSFAPAPPASPGSAAAAPSSPSPPAVPPSSSPGSASAPPFSPPSPTPASPSSSPSSPTTSASPTTTAPPSASASRSGTKAQPSGNHASASPNVEWFASAIFVVGFFTLPSVSGGVGVELGARVGPLRIAVDGFSYPSETFTLSPTTSAGGSVGLVTGGASACLALVRTGRLEVGPCAALEIGRMTASGEGLSASNGQGSALWSAAEAGGYVAVVVVHPIAFGLHAYALVPLVTPRFQIMNSPATFEPSPVEGRALLSAEARF
jgi:hypothetical protein